ncbi:hypothetical protein [Catenulispora rubra]|uniref:hypothetical protein n=1 Tax=Catenulispora rubra TaxID=280293 RepID=UPI0018920A1E|nr:hypothetical protein [Catenulispora rubra]
MNIKTWDELREPDDRTLHFTSWGLGAKMKPENAARYQQEVVGSLELDPAVADGTRRSFDRLRMVFGYGVMCYDLFTPRS